jgi:hypothetical protein
MVVLIQASVVVHSPTFLEEVGPSACFVYARTDSSPYFYLRMLI